MNTNLRAFTTGIALAVAAAAIACGGGEKQPATETAAPGTSSGTAVPTSAGSPGPTVGATVVPSPATQVTMPTRELQPGAPAVLEPGMVLYYRIGCYACGGEGPNLYRAYVDPGSGAVVRDFLLQGLRERYGGYPSNLAADWERGEMYLEMCVSGNCSPEGVINGKERLLHSVDGGVTWEDLGDFPAEAGIIAAGGGFFTVTGDEAAGYVYRRYPSGEAVSPPKVGKKLSMSDVDGLGMTWDGDDYTYYRSDGTPLPAAGVPKARLAARDPQTGDLFFLHSVVAAGGKTTPAIRVVTAGGQVRGDVTVATEFYGVEGVFAPNGPLAGRLYGFVHMGNGNCSNPCKDTERLFNVQAVVFDRAEGRYHPFTQVAEGLTGNRNPYLLHVTTFKFAKVAGAGDCLNVRESPGTQARSSVATGTASSSGPTAKPQRSAKAAGLPSGRPMAGTGSRARTSSSGSRYGVAAHIRRVTS